MIGEGDENEGMTFAQNLAYDDIEQALVEGQKEAPKEIPNGSFEKFMTMMGNNGGAMRGN